MYLFPRSAWCRGLALWVVPWAIDASGASFPPVSPNPLPETVALLQTLSDLSGRHTLTGQHNYPNTKSRNSEYALRYTGRTPAVFSSDWGHAVGGNTDSYLARPDIVQEAIRQHGQGALVTLCWHAVPPTTDEPGTFRPLPGSDPKVLKSVSGQLLDEQFRDVLTPGTALYQHWCEQVDAIAVFLKQLEDARVPVLWRPYHEMNGDWFWWGGRTGKYSTAALYRQIFDRLVHHHHLRNLLWVWSMDRVSRPGMEHEKYFPGLEFVDVLGLDVYQNDFSQSYYDSLVQLSQGKPLALAEVGNPPTAELLARQPRWTYYVVWAGMVRNTPRSHYAALFADPRVLNLEDPAYAAAMTRYRQDCGLPPVELASRPPDFSGNWVLKEEQSSLGHTGAGSVAARLDVAHHGSALTIRSTRIVEYDEDQVSEEQLTVDGSEVKSTFLNSPRITTAQWDPTGRRLLIRAITQPVWGPPGARFTVSDEWHYRDGGQLVVERIASTPRGEQKQQLVYDRR